eukprot:2946580-Prymnesium_polylepis.2
MLLAPAAPRSDSHRRTGEQRAWEPVPGSVPSFALIVSSPELPDYLHTPFILKGYRAHLTIAACARSIFAVHNETVNVWSHLLAAIAFVFHLVEQIAAGKATPPLLVCLMANSAVFIVSTCAHTFCPINKAWHARCWAADWSAIAFAILGNLYPICHFGFAEHPTERAVFAALLAVSCSTIVVLANSSVWPTMPNHTKALVALSPLPVGSVMLGRLVVVLNPGRREAILYSLVPMFVVTTAGLLIYASRVPERWLPGRFDLMGQSHNFHHVWTTTVSVLSVVNIGRWEGVL